jgi:hypothetical protein
MFLSVQTKLLMAISRLLRERVHNVAALPLNIMYCAPTLILIEFDIGMDIAFRPLD